MSCILLLGDAHLRDGDPEIETFLEFLGSLPRDVVALYFLGDLFDLWIGAPEFTTPGHQRVVEALRRLGSAGIRLGYVEGNRDYHLRSLYLEDPFHELAESGLEVAFGRRRLHLAHGDQVNRRDLPYRLWRGLAKGPLLLNFFRALPPALAQRLVQRLERRIARTNQRHRVRFPEEQCLAYARRQRNAGSDTLVLGHFHAELRRTLEDPAGAVEIFVLPLWRDGRRFLRIGSDGTAEFAAFRPGAGAPGP